MEFIKGYMDNDDYRHLLNEITGEIFGFSFEKWYCAGYFEGEYIPYSFLENGKIIANASANIMKMMQNGEEKLYIQIGTVMTRAEYRNRGMARQLIEKILADFEDQSDGFYLFGNLNAVGFYERLGFLQLNQFRYTSSSMPERDCDKAPFLPVGESDRPRYLASLRSAVPNAALELMNRYSLQMFYTLSMENVFYCKEMDCFAVMEQQGKMLHLVGLTCSKHVSIQEVLRRVDGSYEGVILGFTPRSEDAAMFHATPYNGEQEYRFFYKGQKLEQITVDKLYFPVLSHA